MSSSRLSIIAKIPDVETLANSLRRQMTVWI